MVPIPAAALPALDAKVADYGRLGRDAGRALAAFTAKADDVRTRGNDEIRASAETSNKLLASPVRAMQKNDDTGKVATTLVDLRRTVEDLDPSRHRVKKLLGMIPFGDKLRDYSPQVRERAVAHRRHP